MIRLQFSSEALPLQTAICQLEEEYGFQAYFTPTPHTLAVEITQGKKSELSVRLSKEGAQIVYPTVAAFFRGLGHLLSALQEKKEQFSICEPLTFTLNGPMFDVSQGNAVIQPTVLKGMIRKLALMGMNMLMLYCEDSFQVPSQPYFGYMRSRYSHEELQELDAYARSFGIEMIPCIQTLAHLNSVLKWKVYKDFSEDMDTLLVGDERTYAFLEEVIRAAAAPFSSKRIHIGMDEAMMLGQGNYFKLHGAVPKARILREHLQRVTEITQRLGLEVMMWSDMFLRVLDDSGNNYYTAQEFSEEVKASVPPNCRLVYWDYYHKESEFYENFIDKHRLLGEPVFAGGIWTWMGFGPNYTKTLQTTHPALLACKNKGVKEIIATVWGDNGTECSVLATLPMLQVFAEHGYTKGEVDPAALRAHFRFICKKDFDAFLKLQAIDETPGVPKDNWRDHNCSKPLLWQDILSGLTDYNFRDLPLNEHYRSLAQALREESEATDEWQGFFALNRRLCLTLSLKAEAGLRLKELYDRKDTDKLRHYAQSFLPALKEQVEKLRQCHRSHWFSLYKPLGWDIFDMRYGALLARIDTTRWEIEEYLAGRLPSLPELEEPRLPYNGDEGPVHYTNYYGKVVSASRIDPRPFYPHYLG